MLMTHAVMAAAALLGLANAAVFTAIMMGRLGMDSPFARNICRLDAGDCRKVVSSPRARLAGIPNSVVGVAWYLWAGSSAAAAMRTGALPFYIVDASVPAQGALRFLLHGALGELRDPGLCAARGLDAADSCRRERAELLTERRG